MMSNGFPNQGGSLSARGKALSSLIQGAVPSHNSASSHPTNSTSSSTGLSPMIHDVGNDAGMNAIPLNRQHTLTDSINDDDLFMTHSDEDEPGVQLAGPLKIVGREADPFDKEAWDDDFDFGNHSSSPVSPSPVPAKRASLASGASIDFRPNAKQGKSLVFHALDRHRALAKAHGPPSLVPTSAPTPLMTNQTSVDDDADDLADLEALNTHVHVQPKLTLDADDDSSDGDLDWGTSMGEERAGAPGVGVGVAGHTEDGRGEDYEDWDAEIEAEEQVTSPAHRLDSGKFHDEHKARMRHILEGDLDDVSEEEAPEAERNASKDRDREREKERERERAPHPFSMMKNKARKVRGAIKAEHALLAALGKTDTATQQVAIVMYPAPPSLFSLRTLDGFRTMGEKQLEEWLTNLTRKHLPAVPASELFQELSQSNPYRPPESAEALEVDLLGFLQYAFRWAWLCYKAQRYQQMWDLIVGLARYCQRELHTPRVCSIVDDPDAYLLIHNLLFLAAKVWSHSIARTFCALIIFAKTALFPRYARFFELLELETIAHHDGAQANSILRRLCLTYCRVAPLASAYTPPPSVSVVPLVSRSGGLTLATAKASPAPPAGAPNKAASRPTSAHAGATSAPTGVPSSGASVSGASSQSSDKTLPPGAFRIPTEPDAIAAEVALRAVTDLQLYLTSVSPLNASLLMPSAEWDEEQPQYEWLQWAWNGERPTDGSHYRYDADGVPIVTGLGRGHSVSAQLRAIEHFVWRICGSPDFRVKLLYELYSKCPVSWTRAMAANALGRHEWFVDDDKAPEEHIRIAERLLMECVFTLDMLPTIPYKAHAAFSGPGMHWLDVDVASSPLLGELALNALQLFADVMFALNKYKYAIRALEAALGNHEHRCGESPSLVRALSDVCVGHNDGPRALVYHLRILSQAILDGNLDSYVFVLQEVSKMCAKHGNYKRAEELLRKALAFLLALASPSSQALAQALIEARHVRGHRSHEPKLEGAEVRTQLALRKKVVDPPDTFTLGANTQLSADVVPSLTPANSPLAASTASSSGSASASGTSATSLAPSASVLRSVPARPVPAPLPRVEVKSVSLASAASASLAAQLPQPMLEGGLSRLLSVAVADIKASIANLVIMLAKLYLAGDKLVHALVLLEAMRARDHDMRSPVNSINPALQHQGAANALAYYQAALKSPLFLCSATCYTSLPGTLQSAVTGPTSGGNAPIPWAGLVNSNTNTALTTVVTPWMVLANVAASLPKAKVTQVHMLLAQVYMKLSLSRKADRLLRHMEAAAHKQKDGGEENAPSQFFSDLVSSATDAGSGSVGARDVVFTHEYMEARARNAMLLGDYKGALNWVGSAINSCEQSSLHLLGRLHYRKGVIYQAVLLEQLRRGPRYADLMASPGQHAQPHSLGGLHQAASGQTISRALPAHDGHIPASVPYKAVGRGEQCLLLPDPRCCAVAFTKAFNYFEKVDDRVRMAKCLANLAETYLHVIFTAVAATGHAPLEILPWLRMTGFADGLSLEDTAEVAQQALGHFLSVIENFCSNAITTAAAAFLPMLLLQCQLNFAELRMLQGNGAGALTFWLEAKDSYAAAFVVHDQVLLPVKPSRDTIDMHRNVLNRLVRLLFTLDPVIINANLLLLDTHCNFETYLLSEYAACALHDHVEEARASIEDPLAPQAALPGAKLHGADAQLISSVAQAQLATMASLGPNALSPLSLHLLAQQHANPNDVDRTVSSSASSFMNCDKCRIAYTKASAFATSPASPAATVPATAPPSAPAPLLSSSTQPAPATLVAGDAACDATCDADGLVSSSSSIQQQLHMQIHGGPTQVGAAKAGLRLPAEAEDRASLPRNSSALRDSHAHTHEDARPLGAHSSAFGSSLRSYNTLDFSHLPSTTPRHLSTPRGHHTLPLPSARTSATLPVPLVATTAAAPSSALRQSQPTARHSTAVAHAPAHAHGHAGTQRSRCGAALLEDLDAAIAALENSGGGSGSSSALSLGPEGELERQQVTNEMNRVRYLHLAQAADLHKGVLVTSSSALPVAATSQSQQQATVRIYNSALGLVASAASVLSLPLAYAANHSDQPDAPAQTHTAPLSVLASTLPSGVSAVVPAAPFPSQTAGATVRPRFASPVADAPAAPQRLPRPTRDSAPEGGVLHISYQPAATTYTTYTGEYPATPRAPGLASAPSARSPQPLPHPGHPGHPGHYATPPPLPRSLPADALPTVPLATAPAATLASVVAGSSLPANHPASAQSQAGFTTSPLPNPFARPRGAPASPSHLAAAAATRTTRGFRPLPSPSSEADVLLRSCVAIANNALAPPLLANANHLCEHASAWLGHLNVRRDEGPSMPLLHGAAAKTDKNDVKASKLFNGSVEVGGKALLVASRVAVALREVERRVEQSSVEQQSLSAAGARNKETFANIVTAMNMLRHLDLRPVPHPFVAGMGQCACRCGDPDCDARCVTPADVTTACWSVAIASRASCPTCALSHAYDASAGPFGPPTAQSSAANMALFNTFGAIWLGPGQGQAPSAPAPALTAPTGPQAGPQAGPQVGPHVPSCAPAAASNAYSNYIWGNPARVKANAHAHCYMFAIDSVLYAFLPKSLRKITCVFTPQPAALEAAAVLGLTLPSPAAAHALIRRIYAPEEIVYYGESHSYAPSAASHQAASVFDDIASSLPTKPLSYVPHTLEHTPVLVDGGLATRSLLPTSAGLTISSYSQTDASHRLNTPACSRCQVTPCLCALPPCGPTLAVVSVDACVTTTGDAVCAGGSAASGEGAPAPALIGKAQVLQVNLLRLHNLAHQFYRSTATDTPSALPPLPSASAAASLGYPLSHDGKKPLVLPVIPDEEVGAYRHRSHPRESDPELHSLAYRLRFPCPVPGAFPITTPLTAPHLFGLLTDVSARTSADACACPLHKDAAKDIKDAKHCGCDLPAASSGPAAITSTSNAPTAAAAASASGCACPQLSWPAMRIPVLGATHVTKFPTHVRVAVADSEALLPPALDTLLLSEVLHALDASAISLTLSALLCEARLVVVSKSPFRIKAVLDTMLALLYPFRWQGMLVPLLHASAAELLRHKRAYVIGVQASTLECIAKLHAADAAARAPAKKDKLEVPVNTTNATLATLLVGSLELGPDVVVLDIDNSLLKYTSGSFVCLPEKLRKVVWKATRAAASSLFLASLKKHSDRQNADAFPAPEPDPEFGAGEPGDVVPGQASADAASAASSYPLHALSHPMFSSAFLGAPGNPQGGSTGGTGGSTMLAKLALQKDGLLSCAYPTAADPARPTVIAVTNFRNSILDVMLSLFYRYALFWDACISCRPSRSGVHNSPDAVQPYTADPSGRDGASAAAHGYYGVAKPVRDNVLSGPYPNMLPQPRVTSHSPQSWFRNADYDLPGFIRHTKYDYRCFVAAVSGTGLFRHFIATRHRLRGMPACMYLFDQWALLRIHQKWACKLSLWRSSSFSEAVNVARGGGRFHKRLCELHGSRIHVHHGVAKNPLLPMPKHDRLLVPLCVRVAMPVIDKSRSSKASFSFKLVACPHESVQYWLHAVNRMVPGFHAMSLTTLRTHFKLLLERTAAQPFEDSAATLGQTATSSATLAGACDHGNSQTRAHMVSATTANPVMRVAAAVSIATPGASASGASSGYPHAVYLLDGTEETRNAASTSAASPVGAFGPSAVTVRPYTGQGQKPYQLLCIPQQDVPRVMDKHLFLPLFWYALDDLKALPTCPSNAYDVDYITALTEPDPQQRRVKKGTHALEVQKQHLNQYENGCREVPWPLSLLLVCETLKTWERSLLIRCDNHRTQTRLVKMLEAKLQDPEVVQRYQQFM